MRSVFAFILILSFIHHHAEGRDDNDENKNINRFLAKRQAQITCELVKQLIKAAANGPNPYYWEPNCNVRRRTRLGSGGALRRVRKRLRFGPPSPPSNRVPAMKPDENARPQTTAELPLEYNARQVYGRKCPSFDWVWNQEECSNCWAVAATSVINHRTCMYNNENGNGQTTYSLQQAASCNNDFGCNGGHTWMALDYWRTNGLVQADCSPVPSPMNDLNTTSCPVTCQDGKSFSTVSVTKGSQRYEIVSKNEEEIMREIYLYGPIVANMDVYPDLGFYTGRGVYRPVDGIPLKEGEPIYHSVVIHGWGVENGAKYWIVANSWGSGFADGGFFKVEKAVDAAAIESDIHAALPVEALEN